MIFNRSKTLVFRPWSQRSRLFNILNILLRHAMHSHRHTHFKRFDFLLENTAKPFFVVVVCNSLCKSILYSLFVSVLLAEETYTKWPQSVYNHNFHDVPQQQIRVWRHATDRPPLFSPISTILHLEATSSIGIVMPFLAAHVARASLISI